MTLGTRIAVLARASRHILVTRVHQRVFGHMWTYSGYNITFSRDVIYINPAIFEICGSHASEYEE
jgi:hypothetical protein